MKRSSRERSGIGQVALAGYTNSGKSTLMNALTNADVLVADQPFATLDPTTRRLVLPGGRPITISDTVGFVRKLPHDLVEAFKSTLEEVTRAHLVLHVADSSAPDLDQQIEAVREVLGEIGAAQLPEVLTLNKWDLVAPIERGRLGRRLPEGVPVSGLTGEGVEDVIERVGKVLPKPPIEVDLLVPFDHPKIVPWLYRVAQVISSEDTADGARVAARISEAELPRIQEFILRPVARRSRPT